jgi:hypothetical protein
MWKGWCAIGGALAVVWTASPAFAAKPSCYDRVKNGPETDVDCGGDCPPCDLEERCLEPRDCRTGRCSERHCVEQPYQGGAPVPDGFRVETSTTDAAASARTFGIAFLGVSYGAAYVGALVLPGRLSELYLPVIGPFLTLEGQAGYAKGLLIADGVLQIGGAALLVGGIAARGRQLIRVEWAGLQVTPRAAPSGYGLDVRGAF